MLKSKDANMLKKQKKIIVAGAIGNTLEWYDFTIYAFLYPLFVVVQT